MNFRKLAGIDLTDLYILAMLYKKHRRKNIASALCLTHAAVTTRINKIRDLNKDYFSRVLNVEHLTPRGEEFAKRCYDALVILSSSPIPEPEKSWTETKHDVDKV